MSDVRIGIALGSGGARGWAHIGVLRALERYGIQPGIVCGTSIGALVGGVYLGSRLDTLEDWAMRLNKLRLSWLFDVKLGYGGLIAGRRIVQLFDAELRDSLIEDLPARFACVATEYGTGHEVWLQKGNLVEAVRASSALPGLFPPVKVNGHWLLDGALVNPVPVSVCRALGARLVIAVNLNTDPFGEDAVDIDRDSGFAQQATVTRTNGLSGVTLLRQRFARRNDAPSVFSVMASSLNIVQDRLTRSRLAGEPPDATIAPKVGGIGIMQINRAKECIAAGEKAVEDAAPALEQALRRLNGKRPGHARDVEHAL
jgi:NTE family protein